MIEPAGREQLLAMLLARAPDRIVDATAAPFPQDQAELRELRESLADLAHAAEPVAPPARLRERLLATKPQVRRPKRPVLLVLDMLVDHLTPGRPIEVPRARDIVPALKARIAKARAKGTPIIYVCDSHEPDDPDLRTWPAHALAGTEGAEVWPDLAPEPGDRIVRKPTYSAFERSELGDVLNELGADEIILTGCATEVGIRATAVDALQRGYVVRVPADSQAGGSWIGEQTTLLALSTMPPYDPIYLRKNC
jgi:nicotinamidase-related amidase